MKMLFKVQYIITTFIKKLFCHHRDRTRDVRSEPQYFSFSSIFYNTDVSCFRLNPNDPYFILLTVSYFNGRVITLVRTIQEC